MTRSSLSIEPPTNPVVQKQARSATVRPAPLRLYRSRPVTGTVSRSLDNRGQQVKVPETAVVPRTSLPLKRPLFRSDERVQALTAHPLPPTFIARSAVEKSPLCKGKF